MHRFFLHRFFLHRFLRFGALFGALCCTAASLSAQTRSLGIDVSYYQGSLSQNDWNDIHNIDGKEFVFIRSTRGGTTGEDHRQGGYPSNDNSYYNLSQRYDDPRYVQNITRATNAGLLAGTYHFSRPDVATNSGTDEANHMLEMAGAWMRPGYLLPVFDLESGDERGANGLAQFAIDFSDRIHEVTGVRPAMYINGYLSALFENASAAKQAALVEAYPTLWDARYEFQSNPNSNGVQTSNPKDTYSGFYGPWDDYPNPAQPWDFWQYASTGRLEGIGNGGRNVDLNVAQGGIEFVKDHLIPALWTNDNDGQWTTLANWNSGQSPVAPIAAPGQLPAEGTRLLLPQRRLPGADDTVILDRAGANLTVTLASGVQNIRKLEVREALDITGGSLTVNYAPSPDSTPYSARFSAPVSLVGGSLSVHSLQVDASQTFSLGGSLTIDTLLLERQGSSPAQIAIVGDVAIHPLAGAAAKIITAGGAGSSGQIDLGGAERAFDVSDGAAATDLLVDVPIVNGALTKRGDGTLSLGNSALAYAGDTTVEDGTLRIASASLADAADVSLSTGALLDLDFSGADAIGSLLIDGVSQPAGLWGADGSGAQFTSPLLSGAGLLNVSTFLPDVNSDGEVNGADFLSLQRENAALLPQWELAYGTPDAPTSQSVPEPATLGLMLLAAGLIAGRRSAPF